MKSYLTHALVILTICAAMVTTARSQTTNHLEKVPPSRINKFIDSLKIKIARDTLKFNQLDLIGNGKDVTNVANYSKLFIINNKLSYKLDVLTAADVAFFVREFLTPSKIEEIGVLKAPYSNMAYGARGTNGVVNIQLKSTAKIDPAVAQLSLSGEQDAGANNSDKLNIRQ